jgi:hypothetical protein
MRRASRLLRYVCQYDWKIILSESCSEDCAYTGLTFARTGTVLYFNIVGIDDFISHLAQVLLIGH